MIKKISLLFLVFLMLSCTSSRSVVRTTSKTKTTTAKKKVVSTTDTKQSKSPIESNQKNNNGDEIQLEATSNVRTYEEEIKQYVANFLFIGSYI